MRKIYTFLIAFFTISLYSANAQQVATFEDLTVPESGYWNGSDASGEFTSGPATFNNSYINYDGFDVWSGFGYSNIIDTQTNGLDNQYASFAGSGVDGSDNYGIAYMFGEDTVTLNQTSTVLGAYFTNSTWAGLTMRDGDAFTDAFGGADGNAPDWFKLTIKGLSETGAVSGQIEIYLADYRFDDNAKDYILDYWKWFDLTDLGAVKQLTFQLSSSDVGDWGMNTPAYFCVDNLTTVDNFYTVDFSEKELGDESYWNGSDLSGGFGSKHLFFPNNYNSEWQSWSGWSYSKVSDTSTPGYTNQYAAFTGGGVAGSDIYAVSYGKNSITLSAAGVVYGTYVTNATYTALSMHDGDDFAKKFGGETGNDPDWLKLTVVGRNNANDSVGFVEFYLADYRFENNEMDYIVDSWEWLDLSVLGQVRTLEFSLTSSDNGDYGMNTPNYFCLDGLSYEALPEKDVKFVVRDADGALADVSVTFNDVTLATDINGSVVFEMVSPSVQMPVTAIKDGYVEYSEIINGFTVDEHNISLIVDGIVDALSVPVKVYPNPAYDAITIESENDMNEIAFYSIRGELVAKIPGNLMQTKKVSIESLKSGIYFVQVKTRKDTKTIKLVKK